MKRGDADTFLRSSTIEVAWVFDDSATLVDGIVQRSLSVNMVVYTKRKSIIHEWMHNAVAQLSHPQSPRRVCCPVSEPLLQLQFTASSLLRFGRELFECIEIHLSQSTFLRGIEIDFRHSIDSDPPIFVCRERFEPSGCAKAPFAVLLQTNDSEIISLRGGEVEKLFRYNAGDGVVAHVTRTRTTVAIAIKSGHWRLREKTQRLLEYCSD